jgi:elongation factor Ts
MSISPYSEDYNVAIEEFCKVGQTVTVRVLGVDGTKVKLTMKVGTD